MKQIYFIGAHPDDLVGAAGWLLFLSDRPQEYKLQVIDLTRGEYGLSGSTPDATAKIRTQEEINACALLQLEPQFLGAIDGHTYVEEKICLALAAKFAAAPPDLLITHWPVDIHIDHVMCYATVRKALLLSKVKLPAIYGFEESIQTRSVPFNHYFAFDEALLGRKLALCRCYVCQNHNDEIPLRKKIEAAYHGYRCHAPYAEPFAGMPGVPDAATWGLRTENF